MTSTTARIRKSDREALRELMKKTGESAGKILHAAIEDYRRKCFLEEANRAYAALRKDPKGWKAELKERKSWELTLADGLKER